MALPRPGSVVVKQQQARIQDLQPSCALSIVIKLPSAKQFSCMNGGCVLPKDTVDRQRRSAFSLGNSATEAINQKERQQLLWQTFVLDPAEWWDYPPDKRSPSHSNWGHSSLKELLWQMPAWMDSQPLMSKSCQAGELGEAVGALEALVQRGCHIDDSLLYLILKRCMAQKDLVLGRRVHALSVKRGYESNAFLANHIIGMYGSHGKLVEAMQVFTGVPVPNAYMWASIILAHARHGDPTVAIVLYRQMRESKTKPDNHVFVAVLKACATAADLDSGKQVHADILGGSMKPDQFVSSCLVDMYSKCGSLDDARRVFDSLPARNVVIWNAMIAGYAQNGFGQEALALYEDMQKDRLVQADHVTFVCLLQACAGVGALQQGKQLHLKIVERGLEADVVVGSCLVDMYAKCGRLEEARRVFDRLPTRYVVTWTALLNGYAQHGDSKTAMQCFEEMLQQGVEPNDVTFICLLVACSHEGMVNEGRQYFKMMVDHHGIVPSVKHYTSLVDLLGRSGRLNEAESVLQTMPFENDVGVWTSLLNACKSYNDIELATRCFDHLIKLDSENSSPYVLLANIYASAGRWDDVHRVESLRKSAGAWKKPARACVEVKNKVHEFTVGQEKADTLSKVRNMNSTLKGEGGHVPKTELVLKAVSEVEKEDALCGHAEKLALAYGLLNTPSGTTLLVTKNLRMCNDCHSGTKVMSRLEKREIVVRDAQRVHRFMNGYCSCGDRQ